MYTHRVLRPQFLSFRPAQFSVVVGEWDLRDSDEYSEEFRVLDYKVRKPWLQFLPVMLDSFPVRRTRSSGPMGSTTT